MTDSDTRQAEQRRQRVEHLQYVALARVRKYAVSATRRLTHYLTCRTANMPAGLAPNG